MAYSSASASAYALAHVDGPPPGANDFGCRPSRRHPRPVVLVHGTLENMAYNWATLSPLLANQGYCVFALNHGMDGTAPTFPGATRSGGTEGIRKSARQLERFVGRVRRATGSRRVDIVGHSQGGMMPRYYLRFLGGARHVRRLIGLSPSNHGTTVDGLSALIKATPPGESAFEGACRACDQQLVGSRLITKLNRWRDTERGVRYTVIETKYEDFAGPLRAGLQRAPRHPV